ncbi:hypothetical protein QQX98_003954 [Neonectria punicea]|uniref:Cell wall mannoprotein PIR1-like C-terminal domain-containing protein n=1 Tax=Neonectria punicea TaxID=979145 RepID=A0ABR1HC11_9HYPO
MKSSLSLLALAASAFAAPQAVPDSIKPRASAPDGCKTTYDGTFEVTVFKGSESKRDILEKRSCNGEGVLVMTLKDGVLKDAQDRTGYISSSFQLQFDEPAQPDAKITSGFSACADNSLALGSSSVFYQCQSGDFYNLYDRNWAEQCEPVKIVMMPCGSGADSKALRRVVGSSIVATTVVTVVADGTTKEVPTTIAVPMCQIGDGQVQVRTTPCDDMELPVVTAPPVSQVSDGHIQVPTSAPPAQDIPKGDTPEGTTPEGTTPEGDIPEGDTPEGDAPKKSSPKEKVAQPPASAEPNVTAEPGETVLVTDTTMTTASGSAQATRIVRSTTKAPKATSTTEEVSETESTAAANEPTAASEAEPTATGSSGAKHVPGAVFTILAVALGALLFL